MDEDGAISNGNDTVPLLVLEGLEQRLQDPERPEEFVVYVQQRIVINPGTFVAILGPSGCGKTTLLTVLGLLRKPSQPASLKQFSMHVKQASGIIDFDLKQAWLGRKYREIEGLRRKYLGFALQTGELLPALTVRENISAPLRVNGVSGKLCWNRVGELIEAFSLQRQKTGSGRIGKDDLSRARVNKLSGGEYQRVALARAIAHRPRLVFVDEPTAALNRELARGALTQLQQLQFQEVGQGATIMITHDEGLAHEFANMIIRLAPIKNRAAGEVVEVIHGLNNSPLPAEIVSKANGDLRPTC